MEYQLTEDDFVRMLDPSRYKKELKLVSALVESMFQTIALLEEAKNKAERSIWVGELRGDVDEILRELRGMIREA